MDSVQTGKRNLLSKYKILNTTWKKIFILASVTLFIIFFSLAFYNGLVVKKYKVISNKLTENESIRITFVTIK